MIANGRTTRLSFLTTRANPKKLELVGHVLETVGLRNPRLNFPQQAFLNLHHPGAPPAHQMMVMPIVSFANHFEPRGAVAKIESFDQPHFLEQVH